MQRIVADLTWTGDRFESGVEITVDDHGTIAHLGASNAPATVRLHGQALLPGFINGHSHAFQRGLRGSGEFFPKGSGSFWSWREAMYRLVNTLTPESFSQRCRQAFSEMRRAGFTTVGEFHYLHHQEEGDYQFDELLLDAARDVGIRLVLLNTYYKTGDIGRPLEAAQRRFASESLEAFWQQTDHLAQRCDPKLQTMGVVAHSVRAVPIDEIALLHQETQRRKWPFHIHVEEQRREVESCIAAYGKPPLALLNERLTIDKQVTAVHCTQSRADDLAEYLASGGTICICPLTEANLGDGFIDLSPIVRAKGTLTIGTDSNARISALEELRWLEYAQRLRTASRGVLCDDRGFVGKTLLTIATEQGAASLQINAGKIQPGYLADFVAIDLDHPSLAETTEETLLDALFFGASDDVIAATCVGGNWVSYPTKEPPQIR